LLWEEALPVCRREILFVRHGKTDWNDQLRFQGSVDIPLNGEGIRQVERMALRVLAWRPERIIGSPLRRALRTAAAVLSRMPECDFSVLPSLAEMEFGAWEGKTVFQIETLYGGQYIQWKTDPSQVTPEGGESFDHTVERVRGFLTGDFPCGRTLVVSHGGVIRAVLTALFDIAPAVVWRMRIDNAAFVGIEERHGRFSLAFCNDRVHLLDDVADPSLLPIRM